MLLLWGGCARYHQFQSNTTQSSHLRTPGEPTTDVSTSEDGTRRIITKTGVFSGTELHLWHAAPHYDARLPPRPGRPDLTFDAPRRAVACDAEWAALAADHPWDASRRRRRLLAFLQAKLEAAPESGGSEALQLEGAAGLWELSVNREHHADVAGSAEALAALVRCLASPNVEVARACAAAAWALAASEAPRRRLLEAGAVEALVAAARRSLELDCRAFDDGSAPPPEQYTSADRPTRAQRAALQDATLGALAMMLVDRACRAPFVALEPGCTVLFAFW